jgi:hypothetical protein
MIIEILLKDRSETIDNATDVKGVIEITEPDKVHSFDASEIRKLEVIEEADASAD